MNKSREILNKLEQLALKADKDKKECLDQHGEDSLECQVAEAYEEGVFTAFAIAKRIVEENYE